MEFSGDAGSSLVTSRNTVVALLMAIVSLTSMRWC
jgi:hypothetical protein